MTCTEDDDLQTILLASPITSEQAVHLLLDIGANDSAPVLDNLSCCRMLVERPFQKYEFVTKQPTTIDAPKVESSLLQAYPDLFEDACKNATMSILLKALTCGTKISVAVRDKHCKESFVKIVGNVLFFDKHFNLVNASFANVLAAGELHRRWIQACSSRTRNQRYRHQCSSEAKEKK